MIDKRLPIHDIREDIQAVLRAGNRLVITAPTGSGKTTQVPRFILEPGVLPAPAPAPGSSPPKSTGQIIVLQPRRLATRLVALRVAQEMGSPIGQVVGYQTRHDSQISSATRIRFVTEGLFLRLLAGNPTLTGVAAIVLDEFHERNLAADTALALVKTLQETHRPDLRLVVMSATLDAEKLCDYLRCPLVRSEGRMYPVSVHYLAGRSSLPVWELAAEALGAIVNPSPSEEEGAEQSEAGEGGARGIIERTLREGERNSPSDASRVSSVRPSPQPSPLRGEAARAGAEASRGDILIFMPGVYEIRKTIDACRRAVGGEGQSIAYAALHGELPPYEQDAALKPSHLRRVIVATNVAETSITIEGVCHVIDSGLVRVHRFDARRGINVLMVEPNSQASAEQRAGRAGRTAPGSCHRLWPQAEHRTRAAQTAPEVKRLDLAEVALNVLAMGVRDVRTMPWLEPPGEASTERAMQLLAMLGAIDKDGRITQRGRTMARLPMHPRLSRLLVEATARGCLDRATLWAALMSDRDILTRRPSADLAAAGQGAVVSDFFVLERALELARAANFDLQRCAAQGLHAQACRSVDQTRRLFVEACEDARLFGGESAERSEAGAGERRESKAHAFRSKTSKEPSSQPSSKERGGLSGAAPISIGEEATNLIKCLLVAFPDHIGVRRTGTSGPATCALVNQTIRSVTLDAASVVTRPGLIVAVEASEIGSGSSSGGGSGGGGGQGVRTVLGLAAQVEPQWLRELYPDRVTVRFEPIWNEQAQVVEEVEQHLFDDLVFAQTPRPPSADSASASSEILAEQIVKGKLRLEKWDEQVDQWLARVRCVAQWFPERGLITYSDDDLRVVVGEIVGSAVRFSQVRDKPCLQQVKDALSWDDQQFVERMAPDRIELPRGWKMKVEYQPGKPPKGRAKIQDFYGLNQSPSVAGGRQRITLEILGPNFRPLQITDDLANFWANLYPTLRKELSRKYPRHEWR